MTRAIETFPTVDAWAETTAARLGETLGAALRDNGRAVFAGPGGSTPAPVYRRLAAMDLDWSKIAVTLVDERYVPETSPESNARLIRDVLLQDRAASAPNTPRTRSIVRPCWKARSAAITRPAPARSTAPPTPTR